MSSNFQARHMIQGGRCSECGSTVGFTEWHYDTKTTCSANCRKQRERRQKNARSAWVVVIRELQPVRDAIKRGEDLPEYRQQLQRLKGEINDLLMLAKDTDTMEARAMLESRKRQLGLNTGDSS